MSAGRIALLVGLVIAIVVIRRRRRKQAEEKPPLAYPTLGTSTTGVVPTYETTTTVHLRPSGPAVARHDEPEPS